MIALLSEGDETIEESVASVPVPANEAFHPREDTGAPEPRFVLIPHEPHSTYSIFSYFQLT